MKLSPRDRRIAIIGAAIVGLILVYYFGIDTASGRWSQLNQQIAEQEKLLQALAGGRLVRGQAEALRERIGRQVTSYVAREDFAEQIPRMITQLTNFDTYPADAVSRLEPMPIQTNEAHAKCSLSLSFECELSRLVQFLYDLQRAQPLLVVENVRVSTNDREPSLLRVRMALSSFAMLEEEGAG